MALDDRHEQLISATAPADSSFSKIFSDAYDKTVNAIEKLPREFDTAAAVGIAGIALGAAGVYLTRGRVLAAAFNGAERQTADAVMMRSMRFGGALESHEGLLAHIRKMEGAGYLPRGPVGGKEMLAELGAEPSGPVKTVFFPPRTNLLADIRKVNETPWGPKGSQSLREMLEQGPEPNSHAGATLRPFAVGPGQEIKPLSRPAEGRTIGFVLDRNLGVRGPLEAAVEPWPPTTSRGY